MRPHHGINIISNVSGNLGIGVAARGIVQTLIDNGVEVSILDLDPGLGRWKHDLSYEQFTVPHPNDLRFKINLFIVPLAQADLPYVQFPELSGGDSFNAMITWWELPVIPPDRIQALEKCDLVIGASEYIASTLALHLSETPVLSIAQPIRMRQDIKPNRTRFGMSRSSVVFGCSYEPYSDPERKNTMATVSAFQRAFPKGDEPACLFIKVNNAYRDGILHASASLLQDIARNEPRIRLFFETLAHNDVLSMFASCDVVVSLHRSEGLGLTLMEAMMLGKATIATGWSGNMSFMDHNCAALVRYRLAPPSRDAARVYRTENVGRDAVWADPSVEDAAFWMKRLAGDPALRKNMGRLAKQKIREVQKRAHNCNWINEIFSVSEHQKLRSIQTSPLPEFPRPISVRNGNGNGNGNGQGHNSDLIQVNAYGNWLADRTLSDARRQWIFDEMKTWSSPIPRVHLGLFVLPDQHALVMDTLYSMQAQLYEGWQLTVLSFEPIALPAALAPLHDSGRICLRILGDDDDSIEATNRALVETPAEWVGQLWPGDRLSPDALFRLLLEARLATTAPVVIYGDEDAVTPEHRRRRLPLMKPDSNPDLLRSFNYIGQFFLARHDAYLAAGGFQCAHEGAEEYGLLLSLLARHGAPAFAHAPELLYHRHESGRQTHLSPDQQWDLGCELVRQHLQSVSPGAEVQRGMRNPLASVSYPLPHAPLVSIVVPTRDHPSDLRTCLQSVFDRNAYRNFELIIVNHDTVDREALELIADAESRGARVIPYSGPFNYSDMMNRAVDAASGDFILFLNNDVIAHERHWLENLMRHGLRDEVGVVGPKLLLANGTIQHAGVLLGIGNRPAAHPFYGQDANEPGYMFRAIATQNMSAVTGACLLIRKKLYLEVGGMDATELKTWYQDVDLCLKVRARDKLVVFAPEIVLTHRHANTFQDPASRDALAEHDGEAQGIAFCQRWGKIVGNDPAYNKNLAIGGQAYLLESNATLSFDPRWAPRPRVLAFPLDRWGSGEYRIKAPIRQLGRAGRIEGYWSEIILGPSDLLKAQPDSVIFQRHELAHHHAFIERCKTYSSAFRVLEIDDFIHGFREGRLDNRLINMGPVAAGLEKAAGLCDRLVVSTVPLQEEYAHLNTNVVVAPNFIEGSKWRVLRPNRRQRAKPRVGWAGGNSHFGDLMILEDVVKILSPEVDWVFFGICPESIRPWVKEFHGGVFIDAYPMMLASLDLDLALAPLEYNRFNECKSPLRLLEYGALGYPVVCTDIRTFSGDFPVTRVNNRTDDWVDAIRSLIADRDALARTGDRMREHILAHWLLEDNLDLWQNAWTRGS